MSTDPFLRHKSDGGNPYWKNHRIARTTLALAGALGVLTACTSGSETPPAPTPSTAAPSHSKEVLPKENAPTECEWVKYHEKGTDLLTFRQKIQGEQIPILLGQKGADQQDKLWATLNAEAQTNITRAKEYGYTAFHVDASASVYKDRDSYQAWNIADQIEEAASQYYGVEKDPGNTTAFEVPADYDIAYVHIEAYQPLNDPSCNRI